jgi:hypothetical protein
MAPLTAGSSTAPDLRRLGSVPSFDHTDGRTRVQDERLDVVQESGDWVGFRSHDRRADPHPGARRIGGILSVADVVAAVAFGARAALVGRAYLYGLMAGGERGVERAGGLLRKELVRTMQLLGVSNVADLAPDGVRASRPLMHVRLGRGCDGRVRDQPAVSTTPGIRLHLRPTRRGRGSVRPTGVVRADAIGIRVPIEGAGALRACEIA